MKKYVRNIVEMCTKTLLATIVLICFNGIKDVCSLSDVLLTIEPSVVHYMGNSTLRCEYRLQEDDNLYSVKWYRGSHEFYRYTPSEPAITKVFPLKGVSVDESRSNSTQVVLKDIQFILSGNFSCEVTTTTDGPDFHTRVKLDSKPMLVVQVPGHPPEISVGSQPLDYGDRLQANCSSHPSRPPAMLSLKLNNITVALSDFLNQRKHNEPDWSDVFLDIKLSPVFFVNDRLILTCAASIFDIYYEEVELELPSARQPTPERDVVPEFIQVGPNKWLFPEKYTRFSNDYKQFVVHDDDVWITGYPRSGTTWTQDICWLLTHDLDYNRVQITDGRERVKLFEYGSIVYSPKEKKVLKENTILTQLAEDKERRVIKTHLPFSLLPDNLLATSKTIYVVRNIKDIAVSLFNLQKQRSFGNKQYLGTFEEYWNYLENDLLIFNPYFQHVKQGFDQRFNPNVLIIFYEEQRNDLRGSIKKIAKFLEKDLSEKELDELERFMSFENYKFLIEKMKKDFIRKGQVGGWKSYFTPKLEARANKWIETNLRKIDQDMAERYRYL